MTVRIRGRGAATLGSVLVVLAAGCSPADEAEVAGAVLERDEVVEVAEDPEEEPRPDPAPPADPEPARPPEPDPPPPVDDPAGAGEPATPAPDDDTTAGGGSSPRSEPAPSVPEPLVLPAGPGAIGDVVGFSPDGVEILGTGPIDLDEPEPLVAHVRRAVDTDRASCVAVLAAPPDRGLVASGELVVALRSTLLDGTVRSVERQRITLDVTLDPGQTQVLPESPPLTFDRSELGELACTAVLHTG